MEKLWDTESLIQALGVSINKEVHATGVSIDSRTLEPGDIFFALKGPSFNGLNFAKDAILKGAALAIVSCMPENIDESLKDKVLVVEDSKEALLKLGAFGRIRANGKIIGVTGSVGKTTTKEMLKVALSSDGLSFASLGNQNNEYGLPLSLSRLPMNAKYGVFEMGMQTAGEIECLSKFLRPDVSVITNVEAVHLEFFSSVSDIAKAKSEIFLGAEAGGIAIINYDSPYYAIMENVAIEQGQKILNFGFNRGADFRLINYKLEDDKGIVTADCKGLKITYSINSLGKHFALNSLAVLAAAYSLNIDLKIAANGISIFEPVSGRGKVHHLKKGVVLIDDSYNSSPASVNAAIKCLSNYHNRKIAVLGDMKELGACEIKLHTDLVEICIQNNIDRVYTVGALMKKLHEALPDEIRGVHADNSQELSDVIVDEIKEGDAILIKGSFSMNMNYIVQRIIKSL